MNGIFLINKPVGMTSHDVVDKLRKITGERTIGHTGTLDPQASGLLILAIGREFTKQINNFSGLDKEYIAEIKFGEISDTYDSEGKLTIISENILELEKIENLLKTFLGKQLQTAPIYSAKKIKGKKAYELARAGKVVEIKPVEVDIKNIEILSFNYPILKIKVLVSAGTYIRSLAHDIGEKLGVGGYLYSLVRTKIGKFDIENAVMLDNIKQPEDLNNII